MIPNLRTDTEAAGVGPRVGNITLNLCEISYSTHNGRRDGRTIMRQVRFNPNRVKRLFPDLQIQLRPQALSAPGVGKNRGVGGEP